MAEITCIVVTPEATALEEKTDFVALPLYDGEIGIAPNHAPLIGRLGYGELRFQRKNETVRWYIDGGFVQVADNVVSVLTNRAVPAGELNADDIEGQLQAANQLKANRPELMEARDRQVAQARAQLRMVRVST